MSLSQDDSNCEAFLKISGEIKKTTKISPLLFFQATQTDRMISVLKYYLSLV